MSRQPDLPSAPHVARVATMTDGINMALDQNMVVAVPRLRIVIVADVLILEGAANGQRTPPTATCLRDDGRTAYLFRMPEGRWPE